ncbi:MAG: radical SAM protein [Microbacteriaceae bacterium]|nr:radical SAM protein [Burkholderiaceae bacterium]
MPPLPAHRVLSLIPPMTQQNTPYPSTAYLTGFLRSRGIAAEQADLALGLALKLLSIDGLRAVRAGIDALPPAQRSPRLGGFVEHFERYAASIAPTIAFLQGRDATLAHRINGRAFLPEGPRFHSLDVYDNPDRLDGDAGGGSGDGDAGDAGGDGLAWAFGALGATDRARHLATLYLNDIADVVREAVDPRFEFVRYAERLAQSQASFDPLADALAAPPNLLDGWLHTLTLAELARHRPTVVLLSVPFPGAVYAAFRIAQTIKAFDPTIVPVLGGGFGNTELRELSEPRVSDHVDYVTLYAGERPLLALLEHLAGQRGASRLVRTYRLETDLAIGPPRVRYVNFSEPEIAFADVGTPTWDGLPLDRYLSLLDMLNPMHRLWSDGRWNKLTVAHGCYWKKCSFCDVSLDYISRFDAATAETLVDRIEGVVAETGQTGFHFVDEAAPPKSLKALAAELQRRNLAISWWGNIRFEKTFTPALCQQLADSGCIAISGGLEVASDRLLTLMNKGVSVEQVARVTKGFADAGILVHAYLMYGFPTQTVQDTVDALEYVRQLFAAGCIQSGFFHRFACTVHSPVGLDPQAYGVTLQPLPDPGPHRSFAKNDIGFTDPTGVDHDALGLGLKKAVYNFMHGIGLDEDARQWFDFPCPKPRVSRQFISRALAGPAGAKARR